MILNSEDKDVDNFFSREKILVLLELYKVYKPKVGRGEIKTIKKMWEKISIDLSDRCRITIHPSKCENKFNVLERSYKKVVDNNNRTGRGRKDFPYENEFNEIFGKKLNITPKILLNSSEAIVPSRITSDEISGSTQDLQIVQDVPMENIPLTSLNNDENNHPVLSLPERQEEPKRRRKRPTSSYTKRNDILTDIKNDLKTYYAEKLGLQKQKLEIEKKKLEDRKKRTKILEKYLGIDDSSP